jgi:hypothetical protein
MNYILSDDQSINSDGSNLTVHGGWKIRVIWATAGISSVARSGPSSQFWRDDGVGIVACG